MSTEPDNVNTLKPPVATAVATTAPTDSRYIRTYAKDLAAHQGQDPENEALRASAPKEPISKKFHWNHPIIASSSDGAESKPPAIHDEPIIVEPQTPEDRPIDLAELAKSPDTYEAKVTKPLPQDAANADTDLKQNGEGINTIELPKISAGDIIKPWPDKAEQGPRNDILARLLDRAKKIDSVSSEPEQPLPVTPEPEKTPLVLPQVNPAPPMPSVESFVPPTPTPAPVVEVAPAPIHTYTSDFADHIDQQQATAFSVLAAEKDAPIQQPVPVKRKSNVLAYSVGGMLLVLGVAGVGTAYWYMTKSAPVPLISLAPAIIGYDSRVQLSGTGTTLVQALAHETNASVPANNIVLTYVSIATTTREGTIEEPASGGAFISALNVSAPSILLRNIDPSSAVGVVNAGGEVRPFFVLRVLSYERTYSGMLTWEPTMRDTLATLFPLYPAQTIAPSQVPGSTSTPTSAPVASTSNVPRNQFIDEVVVNHDTRALKDESGKTILIYGYVDKQTLIIARNEAAFTLLVSRIHPS